MAKQHPELLQILICQVLQDIGLDRICAECRLFKLQDQVVARLANTLGYELVKAEAARSQPIPTRLIRRCVVGPQSGSRRRRKAVHRLATTSIAR
jgi:hypothetical protein